jgi:hypothetical protein
VLGWRPEPSRRFGFGETGYFCIFHDRIALTSGRNVGAIFWPTIVRRQCWKSRWPRMGAHPVIRPIGYRVCSWWVYGTRSGELLSVVIVVVMRVRVGVVIGVVGWVKARRPSRNGLDSHVGVVIQPADKGRALHLRTRLINSKWPTTQDRTTRTAPCLPPCHPRPSLGSQRHRRMW